MRELTPEPLTAEAFAAFGSVIEARDDAMKLDINQGHAVRYDRLAEVDVADEGGQGVISLFRARPLGELVLKVFERHPLGSQSFVPLSGRPYLVAVAPAGDFDAAKIRLFRADGHQGVHYSEGRLAPLPARPRRKRLPRRRPRRAGRQLRRNRAGARRPNRSAAKGGGLTPDGAPCNRPYRASRSPFSERLRKVIDQRVSPIGAMLCSQAWRASPERW